MPGKYITYRAAASVMAGGGITGEHFVEGCQANISHTVPQLVMARGGSQGSIL
jgi:hypothetical protein